MNNVRTVSDTKRDFYSYHTRPVNSIYRRVVEELMVEMHLLLVNIDFQYDPIYALGVVTSFNRFMQGYEPEKDKEPIFDAIIRAVQGNTQEYQQDAQRLEALAKTLPGQELIAWFTSPNPNNEAADLHSRIQAIANNPKFKYSRLFAVGLYTLVETAAPELLKDEKQRNDVLKQIGDAFHLSQEKLQKDLELYRSNLDKMTQARIALEDTLKAERKKREKRAEDKALSSPP